MTSRQLAWLLGTPVVTSVASGVVSGYIMSEVPTWEGITVAAVLSVTLGVFNARVVITLLEMFREEMGP